MLQNPTFWVLIAFVLFFVVMGRKVWGILSQTLDDRAGRIRQEIEAAQKLKDDAQAAFQQYQRRQRDALKEAEAIIAAAREEADRIRAHAQAATEAALKQREQQAVEKIAQAEAAALQQVRDLAVDIAVTATEKLLADNLDDARGTALIDKAIAELPNKVH
jgi:F-type H+-transporting ATPase subunit b